MISLELIDSLPDYLGERIRVIQNRLGKTKREESVRSIVRLDENQSPQSDQRFVLYWMRTAVRIDENPALDVARLLADQLKLPLLIYHALNEDYQYASDRHHTFILEGARDVQQQACLAGLSYAFHLATPQDRRPHLWRLANRAAVVITEEMPVDPPRKYLNTLAVHTQTTILAVDTACVVPMRLVKKAYTRAFEFRNATKKLYAQRLSRPWPQLHLQTRSFDLTSLPFQPLQFDQHHIPDLVAECEIDHAVGAVADTPGGSEAGYARWEGFLKKGIYGYAKRRNDAVQDGVSRMSAYLHYGMVSPLRIARDAAAIDHPGVEKYLDELLIWRELAYSFCFHRPDHDQWSAIPDWAQATLTERLKDRRPVIYSWEELARGQTDSPLWNAAQRSLFRHGELHNNLRMTWGKAFLNWTKTPQLALEWMIDLNHRYALDGRDPCSYGGLLWCLGQFDRPFTPAQPIFGTVRPRPIEEHAARMKVEGYIEKMDRWRGGTRPHVAVIGAGISGLMAARTLADHGVMVTVFEKSRGLGGRMATRRVDGVLTFDHGAQYFTARDKRFRRYVDSWKEQGLVARWPADTKGGVANDRPIVSIRNGQIEKISDSVERWVAVPSMNAICKHLGTRHPNLRIELETRIEKIVRRSSESVDQSSEQNSLLSTIGLSSCDGRQWDAFDRLIVSAPAGQAAELLGGVTPIAEAISKIQMAPCWAAMIELEAALPIDWSGAFLQDSFLAWVARNQTKPGRKFSADQLVIHAGPDWTQQNWDRDPTEVAGEMLAEFWRVTGLKPIPASSVVGHRWKFSIPTEAISHGCFFDADRGIAACGDWANGARVEGAFLSGMAAAGRILGSFHQTNTANGAQDYAEDKEQLRLF